MSLEQTIETINMKSTKQVQRTEYSVQNHWELIKKVTGIDTAIKENRPKAQEAFLKKWEIYFSWEISISSNHLANRGRTTSMGHAIYSEDEKGKSDFDQAVTNPFTSFEDVYKIDFYKEYGEYKEKEIIKEVEDSYRNNVKTVPYRLHMTGTYITLLSGLIEIFGWDHLLMAMGSDINKFNDTVKRYYEWIKQFYDAIAKSNVPYFMCHDDIAWTSGLINSKKWYQENLLGYYERLWEPLKKANKKIFFTSDGNYTEILDDIAALSPDMVVMEPTTDMKYFAKKYGDKIGFIGNADVRILMHGDKSDIYKEVERCMNIGKEYPGFIMATGNHIPANTPVDSCLYYNDAYMKMRER